MDIKDIKLQSLEEFLKKILKQDIYLESITLIDIKTGEKTKINK
ncbi:hypothetical protein [Anaerofustis butyriciformans]|nr:hypothetical protein [Anaerofustis sp. HA2171]